MTMDEHPVPTYTVLDPQDPDLPYRLPRWLPKRPTDALEAQAMLAKRQHDAVSLLRDLGERVPLLDRALDETLSRGATFFVGGAASPLVVAGSTALPAGTILRPEYLPAPDGFCLLESPLWLAVPADPSMAGKPLDSSIERAAPILVPVGAFSWSSVLTHVPGEPSWVPPRPGVEITPFGWAARGMDGATLVTVETFPIMPQGVLADFGGSCSTWCFGDTLGRVLGRRPGDDGTFNAVEECAIRAAVRLFGALSLFLQQRLLANSSRPVDRHARKRLAQQGRTEDLSVRVIHLRVREQPTSLPVGESEPVEWSCRWVVRGHWRMQPVGPGLREARPTWIGAYVKGPDNKPLKLPPQIIFDVDR